MKCSKNEQQSQNLYIDNNLFFECADLVLPWLSPPEIANISFTCKTLYRISKTLTHRRSLDASRSLEKLCIPFYNAIDAHPYAYFRYTPSQILNSSSTSPQRQSWGSIFDSAGRPSEQLGGHLSVSLMDESGESVHGCDCSSCEEVDDDGFGCPCVIYCEGLGIVSECGPICGCGVECGNRLTQRGVSVKLKIVRDRRKGWSLFADQLIQQGQFVCEYAGELLTTKEARRRQQIYDELASGGRFSSALLVVREHLPSQKACLRMNIDATTIGNVARFINHSCDGGNLSTVLVRSSGALLPRLCFFAAKDIKEGEELTFSYGEIRLSSKGLQCFCGTQCCFGTLPSETT
ncbi:histone-lysine N-methyltransferase SUVR3-like [Tripterygium wilfordii]|uniref:Histone-lysine N-methyltransferase SUVR3-like n=1 Tax=Tripterygium wilfordii TaxID=458696 RepID=A0A7J7BV41_TRIWF|nr:histone-lysine N-methyltransferase SUVR3 [Tripterygium wilfordii]KAF5725741.1 histone-lysine N-methyltransferase SUVR3-like [Tripterygium wilfordii]